MPEILITIIKISAVIAIPVSSMAVCMEVGRPFLHDIKKYKSIIIRYVIAMFIIAPALVVIFYFLLPEYRPIWMILLVVCLSPPTAGIVKKIGGMGMDKTIGLILVIIGILLSIIIIPLVLVVLENVLKIDIDLGIVEVIKKIAIIFIIPSIVGFLIAAVFEKAVPTILKILGPIIKIATIVLLLAILIIAVPLIIKGGIIPVLLVVMFEIVLLIVIHYFSLPEKDNAPAIPYSVIMKLPAPAVVISQINDRLQVNLPTILLAVIVGAVLIAIYTKFLKKKTAE